MRACNDGVTTVHIVRSIKIVRLSVTLEMGSNGFKEKIHQMTESRRKKKNATPIFQNSAELEF